MRAFAGGGNFEPGLGEEVAGVLGTAINLGMRPAPATTFGFGYSRSGNTGAPQWVLHLIQVERLDDRHDQHHE
jgi:hypothetical protein